MELTRYQAECDFENLKELTYDSDWEDKSFDEYDYIYPFTNDRIKSIFNNLDVTGGLLTVTGSGDHALNGILHGATRIVSFDINKLAKYFSELKRIAILTLEYDEFIEFYRIDRSLKIPNHNIFVKDISKPLYYKVCSNLDFANARFFELLIEFLFNTGRSNFSYRQFNPLENEYIDPFKYYELKEKIQSVLIEYIDSDIITLDKKLNDDKYSAIVFSNILNYFSLGELKGFYKMVQSTYSKKLSEDGIIQLGIGSKKQKDCMFKGSYRLNPKFIYFHKDYVL